MADSGLLKKFLDSMAIDYEKWHDGVGYDLEALREMTGPDRQRAEDELISRCGDDWRDMEALAELKTARAILALKKFLHRGKIGSRLAAAEYLHELGELDDLGPVLEEALRTSAGDFSLFSRAMDLVAEHRPGAVLPTLLDIARSGEGVRAVNAAAMLFYLRGKAEEPFDWDRRPFFLRFAEPGEERRAAFRELCETLKIYPR
ncbi:MAG: hypothetical protein IT436_06280 [Phycisphaerales bacterium]|nr:hypothetical protein [Phycisphaerales bacterium]